MKLATTLERVLPDYDQREVHSRWINADPQVVWSAVREVTAADLPLAWALTWVRSGGRDRLAGPLLDLRPALQPLSETNEHEIVRGLVTKAWQPAPKTKKLPGGLDSFTAFDEPGWVKIAIDLRLIPERGGTRLSTETRCRATDVRSRVLFGLYWAVIRAGSGLIRRETLRAIAHRAVRGTWRRSTGIEG